MQEYTITITVVSELVPQEFKEHMELLAGRLKDFGMVITEPRAAISLGPNTFDPTNADPYYATVRFGVMANTDGIAIDTGSWLVGLQLEMMDMDDSQMRVAGKKTVARAA